MGQAAPHVEALGQACDYAIWKSSKPVVYMQHESRTVTDTLALVGAITGTIGTVSGIGALLWDYYKWRTSGRPKLKMEVSGPMIVFGDPDRKEHFTVSVVNVGDRATTIELLCYRYYKHRPAKIFRSKSDERGFFNLQASFPLQLPRRLEIGEMWKTVLPLRQEFRQKAEEGYLFIEIEESGGPSGRRNTNARMLLTQ